MENYTAQRPPQQAAAVLVLYTQHSPSKFTLATAFQWSSYTLSPCNDPKSKNHWVYMESYSAQRPPQQATAVLSLNT